MRFISVILLFILPVISYSKSKLPTLKTKQSILNIRYVSRDGKVTYFQNSSGTLTMSAYFKNHKILQLAKGTQYLVYNSTDRKTTFIEADETFHNALNFNKNRKLYMSKFGSPIAKYIDEGLFLGLHLKDTWYSYFKPLDKEIIFKRTGLLKGQKKIDKYSIVLSNRINPYFRPKTFMVNDRSLLYTDLNKEGFSAIMNFNPVTKAFIPIYKTKAPGMSLEMCKLGQTLVVGEFSLYDVNRGSMIMVFDLIKDPTFKKPNIIYSSNLNDFGKLNCHEDENKVFFIKSLKEDLRINYRILEVVAMDIGTGSIKIRSDLNKVTQVTMMDNRVIVPFRGEFYLVAGTADLSKESLLSAKDFGFIKDVELNDLLKLKKKKRKKRRKRRRKRSKKRKKKRSKKRKKKKSKK
jgi:hypothetical protein